MSIGRRAVAAVISLVIVAASWVLGLGAFLWTFAATDFRWIAFAVSVLVAETMRRAALALPAVLAAAV